jgi:predicted phage terminase large subunit-like protein
VESGIYFQPDWFASWHELPPRNQLMFAAWIDQSLGKAKTSDYKAIVLAASDGRRYYILDAWVRRAGLGAMVKAAYAFYLTYKSWGLPCVHIEDNFGQYSQISRRDFQDAAAVFGFPLPVKPMQNTVKKEARIEGLGPLMENKLLLWPEKLNTDLQTLKDQMLGYPDAANDDGPDALAGAVEVIRSKRAARTGEYRSLAKRRYRRRH